MEVFQAYLKAFKKCVSDYFGEDVLPGCFDGCQEFRIVVLGKMRTGKSTLINALVGKQMMPTKPTVGTVVITTVGFGDHTKDVTVFYTDRPPMVMSLKKFTEEFTWSEADEELIGAGGRPNRFANVSHAEIQSTDHMFADGMLLIDSPGLEEDITHTRITNELLPKANAIIFTMSAVSLFSAREKEYIAENFAGKEMRNVFFVINRIDQLSNNMGLNNTVIPCVQNGLRDVFTDTCGVFDEELFKKRVFFTNAYGALCARAGEPCKIFCGRKFVTVPIELEDTGIPEFEEALLSFVDEQRREMCKLTMQLMVRTYQMLYEKTLGSLKKDGYNPLNYGEHDRGDHTDPRMGALQAMREYMGYCFEDLYGHQPTDLELGLMA